MKKSDKILVLIPFVQGGVFRPYQLAREWEAYQGLNPFRSGRGSFDFDKYLKFFEFLGLKDKINGQNLVKAL